MGNGCVRVPENISSYLRRSPFSECTIQINESWETTTSGSCFPEDLEIAKLSSEEIDCFIDLLFGIGIPEL